MNESNRIISCTPQEKNAVTAQMDAKGKDCSPAETVARFERILREIGVSFREIPQQTVDGACSLRLIDPVHGWQVNGKGADALYCRASAYGEAMERLQNRFIFVKANLSPEAQSCLGFTCWPDEEPRHLRAIREADDLWADFRAMRRKAGEAEDMAFLRACLDEEETPFVPFYSIRQGRPVMLPDRLITLLSGSNGIAAGNTCPEALCQALCEIAERYAKFRAFREGLTPPEIPDQALPERLMALKRRIEEKSGFCLTVLDMSLGQGFPVAGLLAADQKKQRYRVKFGAHPRFDLAVERCLTEFLQGYDPASPEQNDCLMILWTGQEEAWSTTKNLASAFRIDLSVLPDSFLGGRPSWEFVPWEWDEKTNGDCAARLIALFLCNAKDVYIRNTGFLGVPSFRVYIPGISVIPQILSPNMPKIAQYREWLYSLGYRPLSGAEAAELLEALDDPDLPFGGRDADLELPFSLKTAKALLHYQLGETGAAQRLLEEAVGPKERCMARALELRKRGVSREQEEGLLRRFFGLEIAQSVLSILASPEQALRRWQDPLGLLAALRDQNAPRLEAEARAQREAADALYRTLKQKMKDGMPVQDAALWIGKDFTR